MLISYGRHCPQINDINTKSPQLLYRADPATFIRGLFYHAHVSQATPMVTRKLMFNLKAAV